MTGRPGFAALASARFRLYLAGQLVSLSGSWLQQIATSWLVYRLTGSSAAVGATLLLAQLPVFVLGSLAGVAGDRFDRQRLLIATQVAGGLQALLLGLAVAAGKATLPLLLGFSAVLGLVNALDTPLRQSLVPSLVDRREDIRNAVALNSACLHLARFIGAAAAALLLTRFDETSCFLVNAASYAASLGALLAIGPTGNPSVQGSSGRSLADGLRYCSGHPQIRAVLLLIAASSLIVVPYPTLLPAAIRGATALDAGFYARLMSCAGAGSIGAALVLARWHSDRALLLGMPLSLALAGAAVGGLGLGISSWPSWAAIVAVGLAGFALTIVISGSNAFIQHHVPDQLRGRVMGLFTVSFNGLMPIGSLVLGTVADAAGTRATLEIMGALALLIAAGSTASAYRRPPLSPGPGVRASGPDDSRTRCDPPG